MEILLLCKTMYFKDKILHNYQVYSTNNDTLFKKNPKHNRTYPNLNHKQRKKFVREKLGLTRELPQGVWKGTYSPRIKSKLTLNGTLHYGK